MAENWGIIEVERMVDGWVLLKAGRREMPMDSRMVLKMVLRKETMTVALMDSHWVAMKVNGEAVLTAPRLAHGLAEH